MKALSSFLLLTLILMTTAEEQPDEELPKAEAYRSPPRHPSNRGGYGGPSYDLDKAYMSMSDTRAANRNGYSSSSSTKSRGGYSSSSSGGGYSTDRYSSSGSGGYSSDYSDYRNDPYGDTRKTAYNDDQYYQSASEYGGYGSESGYGLSCASGYVNASAVALLAFLFLLNIVQDVIQQITGGRRRRDADDEDDVMSFVSNGGLTALKEGLPEVVLPLMVELLDATENTPRCLQRPICQANARLSLQYGAVGRVVGSLLSNVVSKAFSKDDNRKFHMALEAAAVGRDTRECGRYEEVCEGGKGSGNGRGKDRREEESLVNQDL